MEGSTKGDGAPRTVNQGTTKIIEKDEHEIPNIQAFIPTPSNDEEVKDVLLPTTFVNTPKEGTNTVASHLSTQLEPRRIVRT